MEAYPLRAPGELAGSFCTIRKCPNQSRFYVFASSNGGSGISVCGHHIPNALKGIHLIYQVGVIVQEIPGYKQRETVLFPGDDKLVSVAPSDRREVMAKSNKA